MPSAKKESPRNSRAFFFSIINRYVDAQVRVRRRVRLRAAAPRRAKSAHAPLGAAPSAAAHPPIIWVWGVAPVALFSPSKDSSSKEPSSMESLLSSLLLSLGLSLLSSLP